MDGTIRFVKKVCAIPMQNAKFKDLTPGFIKEVINVCHE